MRGRGVKKKEKAIIREKIRNGANVHVLAEEHSLSARTIYRIISETRRGNKKKGRKNALTSAQRRSLIRKSHEKPLLSAAELAKSLQISVTPQTIRNKLFIEKKK